MSKHKSIYTIMRKRADMLNNAAELEIKDNPQVFLNNRIAYAAGAISEWATIAAALGLGIDDEYKPFGEAAAKILMTANGI